MAKKQSDDAAYATGEAVQWKDMPREARASVNSQVRELGMAKTNAASDRESLQRSQQNPKAGETTRKKAGQALGSLEALEPVLQDKPITHAGAAAARVKLTMQGAQRSRETGEAHNQDWYFRHNKKLSTVAEDTGYDSPRVIAASAVMSPQNSPEQELTAVNALAHAHSNRRASVRVTEEAASAHEELDYQERLKKATTPAAKRGVQREVSPLREYIGSALHPRKLAPEHLAVLSTPGIREHVGTKGVDLESMAKGGTKENVSKAINILRGNVAPHEAIDPHSSPKVWSYHHNIAQATFGSAEHTEFTERMHRATGGEMPGQERMDLFGLRTATHGPLSPTGHTAEDTWQQAISTRQPLAAVRIPGRQGRAGVQSPAKFSVGKGGSADQKKLRAAPGMPGAEPSLLMHAWQNEATQRASRVMSKRSGELVPTAGIQAGAWIEARRQAGKNIEEQTRRVKPRKPPQQLSLGI